MHTPVADRRNGFAGQDPTPLLRHFEFLALEFWFLDHKRRQASMTQRQTRISPSKGQQNTGYTNKGTPGLGTIEQPAIINTGRFQSY